MRREITYDVHAMKKTAEDARRILLDIQGMLDRAGGERAEAAAAHEREWGLCVQELEKVCRGYEILTLILDTSANLYGSAGLEAAEIASFR